jgi:hypothetical protein
MRTLLMTLIFNSAFVLTDWATLSPPIEIPVTITQGRSVRVPFSVPRSGTYDLMLQYPALVETYENRTLDLKLRRELAGTVTLSCDGRTLKHTMPTGWGRALSGRVTTVIVRFRA